MVRITVDSQRFGFIVGYNATDVPLYLFSDLFGNQILSAFYDKHNLNVYLGVGIWHVLGFN